VRRQPHMRRPARTSVLACRNLAAGRIHFARGCQIGRVPILRLAQNGTLGKIEGELKQKLLELRG